MVFLYLEDRCLEIKDAHFVSEPLRGSEWILCHRPYPRLHSLRSFSLGLLKVYLSEALSMFSRLFGIAAEPNVGVGFIPILQGQQRLTASEAVRYPFSACCLTAAGCGPCGRPLTIVNCIYALFIFGRPQGPHPAVVGLTRIFYLAFGV